MYKKISTPLRDEDVKQLKAGDYVLLSGIIYSARDAAHRRMIDSLESGEKLPVDLNGQIIYYAGPCPAKPGQIAGPYGPTTSGRMDRYTPALLDLGLKGMIGKGERDTKVIESMKQHKVVYFAAIGGLGALIATTIKKQETVAYDDLGAEAMFRLEVEDFPLIVAIDFEGNNLYQSEPPKFVDRYTELTSLGE